MIRKTILKALFLVTLTWGGSGAQALDCEYCEGKDLGDLLELSVSRSSPALRAQIRGWIAEKHPDTPAGYAARAWVLGNNGGGPADIFALYNEAIQRDPSLGLAFTNGGYQLERLKRFDEAVELFKQGARAWPQHAFFVEYAYLNLKENKSAAAAEAFLRQAEQDGVSDRWVFDYVRGVKARSTGNRAQADRLFRAAMDQGGNFDAFKAWYDNRMRLLAAERANRNTRLDAVREGLGWAREMRNEPALRYIGNALSKDFNLRADAFNILSEAYAMNPTPDAAEDAFTVIGNDDFDAGLEVLERGLLDFPNNYKILMAASWAWTDFRLAPERAEVYAKRAIDNAPTNAQLYETIRQYSIFAERTAVYDNAVPYFERHLPELKSTNYRNLLGAYIDNRIAARDFAQANRLLERARDFGGLSESWMATRINRVATALRLAGQRDRFFAENPFLLDWARRFGDSLRVTVEFATGKADIRPEGFGVLDRAAGALNAPGGENYVFLIEGHTDSTGTDKINLPLSDARAKAVEQYFIENAGIASERIQTVGFGPRIPLADNNSDAGRQDNRRVEIRPYGNISAPRIATSGWLNADSLRLSPDGRFAVTGNTPTQVWDLERMVRVHQLPIGGNTREISPNGRYIAIKSSFLGVTGATDHMLYIYDMRTGEMHSQIPNNLDIDEIAWSPFSDAVAFSDRNGFLRVFDMPSRKIRSVAKMGSIRGSEEITWVGTGAHIVTKVPRSSTAVVLDAKTLEPVKRLANTGWLHSLVSTKDGAHVVGINNDYQMIIWRTSDWAEVTRKRMPAMSFFLVAHPSKQQVMIVDSFTNSTRLALVDVPSGQVVGQYEDSDRDTVLHGAFTPDGGYFVTTMDEQITYIDTQTMRIDRQKSGNTQEGKGLTMVPSQDMVLSRDEAGTSVWSVKTGRRVHRIEGAVEFAWKPLSADGSVLFSFDEAGNMLRFDTATFRSEAVMQVEGKPYSMRENDRFIALGTVPAGDGPFRNPTGKIYVIDKATMQTVMRKDFEIVSEPADFAEIYSPRIYVRLADNGLVAVTSAWQSGFKQSFTDGRVVTTYDPAQNRELTSFRAEERFFKMEWGEGGEVVKFRGTGRWYLHDPQTGKQTGRETPEANFEIKLSDGRRIDWFWDHVALDGKEITFPHTLRHLEVHEGRRVAVGLTTGNELIFIDLNTMQQALTIAPQQGDEWIAFTPDGRYTASLNGTEGVYWSLGDNYLPFSALAEQYERPSLIRNLLEAIAKGDALPEDGPDVDADVFEAPYTLSLLSPPRSTTEAETFTVELEVLKDNADLADPEIEYTLNGRRVLKSRGFEEEAFFDGEETVGFTRRFDLNPGQNVIEASLVWRDARIQTQRIEITRDSGETPEVQTAGQTLWFFGVGVSDYERSSQNLNFAHKDAIELARLMEAQEGKLFDRVETRILTNQEASERNVRIQMNEFLDQAGDDDVIVLFLAGHGVVDDEQELYFMTHEGDLAKPYTGMSVNRFRSLLENRPLNQNALMLLDICHSGAGDSRVVAEDAVQNLTKGTGAVVFASSSGSELSFEDESFGGGHGAFTAALLEGLTGLADSRVGNRDGFNSLQEMVLFTSSRVPELTEGQQRPQIPALALNVDYLLSATVD